MLDLSCTKSLFLGFESKGGTCGTTPYPIPYFLRSVANAESAAIDYSKEDIEDNVVNSPPSCGFVRTPRCSLSSSKRASSTPTIASRLPLGLAMDRVTNYTSPPSSRGARTSSPRGRIYFVSSSQGCQRRIH